MQFLLANILNLNYHFECTENGDVDTNGACMDTAAVSTELAQAIAAEVGYLQDSLGGAVLAESARPQGCVVIARETTTVQLPSGGSAAVDVLVAAPAAAVASGANSLTDCMLSACLFTAYTLEQVANSL